MDNRQTFNKFPENWANLDYNMFEKFLDGSTVWQGGVFGMGDAEVKLLELSQG